jgi:hypothetical protein
VTGRRVVREDRAVALLPQEMDVGFVDAQLLVVAAVADVGSKGLLPLAGAERRAAAIVRYTGVPRTRVPSAPVNRASTTTLSAWATVRSAATMAAITSLFSS